MSNCSNDSLLSSLGLPPTVRWVGDLDGCVELIDQTLLPGELRIIQCRDVETLWEAIRSLRVRGAPALGVAGAYGVLLGAAGKRHEGPQAVLAAVEGTCDYLGTSRPTAVNLFWALDRQARCARSLDGCDAETFCRALLAEAQAIHAEDEQMCEAIGRAGADLIQDNMGVITHCNAGALATAGAGTALAVLYEAHRRGRQFTVYADETRPLLQGARLTTWELSRAGIDVTLACDNMAAVLMRKGKVHLAITGADRIAANGDAANKIGTYGLAVLAKAHGVPFYVAAPASTFDLSLTDGAAIPIEQRSRAEVAEGFGRLTAPKDVPCYNPAFDVTPAELISGIITDRGLISPVGPDAVSRVLGTDTENR